MLPANLLSCEFRGPAAIPRFLGEADRPWVRTLIDECERFSGRPVRELEARLRDPAPGAPDDKRRLVAHLLLGLARSHLKSALPPREARAALFTTAGRFSGDPRNVVIDRCAMELGVAPAGLMGSLFTDLPSERIAMAPPSLDPGEVVLRANPALAQGLLRVEDRGARPRRRSRRGARPRRCRRAAAAARVIGSTRQVTVRAYAAPADMRKSFDSASSRCCSRGAR